MLEGGVQSEGEGGYGRGIAYMLTSLVLWVIMNAIINQARVRDIPDHANPVLP